MNESKKICPILSIKGTPMPCACEACAWYRQTDCAIWVIAEMLQGINIALFEG